MHREVKASITIELVSYEDRPMRSEEDQGPKRMVDHKTYQSGDSIEVKITYPDHEDCRVYNLRFGPDNTGSAGFKAIKDEVIKKIFDLISGQPHMILDTTLDQTNKHQDIYCLGSVKEGYPHR